MKLPDNLTLYIALWGAGLGTLTFCWNILRWRQERPRVLATVETVESVLNENKLVGIRMTLRNRGGKKTTIEHIYLYEREPWFEHGFWSIVSRLRRELRSKFNIGAANPDTVRLPKTLDVNESWQVFIQLQADEEDSEEVQDRVDRHRSLLERLQSGKLRYSIECSHTSRKLRGLVRPELDAMTE